MTATTSCGKSLTTVGVNGLGGHETARLVDSSSFNRFRIHYLVVFIAIMLADGLQGERDMGLRITEQ